MSKRPHQGDPQVNGYSHIIRVLTERVEVALGKAHGGVPHATAGEEHTDADATEREQRFPLDSGRPTFKRKTMGDNSAVQRRAPGPFE